MGDWLEDEELRVSGVVEAARASGVNLVCFVGASLHAPLRFGRRREAGAREQLGYSQTFVGFVFLLRSVTNWMAFLVMGRDREHGGYRVGGGWTACLGRR